MQKDDLLNEIYNLYKDKVKEADSMWKSEWCCSQEESDRADKESQEELNYFKELLRKINKDFIPMEENNAE